MKRIIILATFFSVCARTIMTPESSYPRFKRHNLKGGGTYKIKKSQDRTVMNFFGEPRFVMNDGEPVTDLEKLQHKVQVLAEKNSHLNQKNIEQEVYIKDLNKNCADLQKEVNSLAIECEKWGKSQQEIKEEYQTCIYNFDESKKLQHEALKTLSLKEKEHSKKVVLLEKAKKALEKKQEKHERELTELQEKHVDVLLNLKNLKISKDEAARNSDQEIKNFKKISADLNKQIKRYEEKELSLGKKLESFEKREGESSSQIASLQGEKQDVNQQKNLLEKDLESKRKSYESLQKDYQKVIDLMNHLKEEKNQAVKLLADSKKEHKSSLREMKKDFVRHESDKKNINKQLNACGVESDKCSSLVENLKNDLNQKDVAYETLASKCKELETVNHSLQEKMNDLRDALKA
jgi:chromosome segregation ATPase